MDSIELLSKLEGNLDKQCTLTLKDGTVSKPLCFGSTVDDYGIQYLKVSEGKSEKLVPFVEVKSIEFLG